jgi:hypothetical protein
MVTPRASYQSTNWSSAASPIIGSFADEWEDVTTGAVRFTFPDLCGGRSARAVPTATRFSDFPGTYPGTVVQMPNGSIIKIRPSSSQQKSGGGPTIDITTPNGKEEKVHIRTP